MLLQELGNPRIRREVVGLLQERRIGLEDGPQVGRVLPHQFVELGPHPAGVTRIQILPALFHDERLKFVGHVNLWLRLGGSGQRNQEAGDEGNGVTFHTLNNGAVTHW